LIECEKREAGHQEATLHVEHTGAARETTLAPVPLESAGRKDGVEMSDERNRFPFCGGAKDEVIGEGGALLHVTSQRTALEKRAQHVPHAVSALDVGREGVDLDERRERRLHFVGLRFYPRDCALEGVALGAHGRDCIAGTQRHL